MDGKIHRWMGTDGLRECVDGNMDDWIDGLID